METLVIVLWAVYLSECLSKVRPGEWVFKGRVVGALRATGEPDLCLMADRWSLALLPLAPWGIVYRCSGSNLDAETAVKRVLAIEAAVKALRLSAGVLFFVLLPGLSALVWSGRTAPFLLSWAIVALGAWGPSAWCFFRAWREVHGTAPSFEVAATHLLSPLSLVRSALQTSWTATLRCHPVAAASVLCDDRQFLRVARLFHFDEPDRRQEIEHLLSARRLLGRLSDNPVPEHPSLTRFCPRCHATYRESALHCADCTQVSLLHFNV